MEHNENKQNFESDNIMLLWAVFLATVEKICTIEQKMAFCNETREGGNGKEII